MRFGIPFVHLPTGVTRGLDHASRIYPTCAFEVPKSGKPDFGAVHRSSQTALANKMDCRLEAGNDDKDSDPAAKTA
jgi:hypothetical protein